MCFRACFPSGRAKDLSAPRYIVTDWYYFPSKSQIFNLFFQMYICLCTSQGYLWSDLEPRIIGKNKYSHVQTNFLVEFPKYMDEGIEE